MGLQSVIRTAIITALGAKLARGRSPIVGALIALLLSRALAKKTDEKKPDVPGTEDGLGGLVERFRQGGLEEIIKSAPVPIRRSRQTSCSRRSAPRQLRDFPARLACRAMICSRSSRACFPRLSTS